MDSIEKTIVKGRLPDGKAVSIYGDASDQSVRGNIWIIFHEDAGDRLSFISKEGLNISIVNKDKESLIFSVHFEKDFGDVVFDENRTPVVEMDYATLIDSNEWILSDEGNFYSFVLDKSALINEIGEGYEFKVRAFTAEIDDFEGVQINFGVHDFRFLFNDDKPLLKIFFPNTQFVDLNTGEIIE